MELNTRHFGKIEIDENGIIDFPEGIPGFEDSKRFILIGKPEKDNPFIWLQSLDDENLAFVVIDPFSINPEYYVDVDDEDIKLLGIESPEDVMTLAIVVIPEDIMKMTANLQAPVIINVRSKKGKQITLNNEKFPVKYYIIKETKV